MCVTHEVQEVLRILIRVKLRTFFLLNQFINISGEVSCLLLILTSAPGGVPLLHGYGRNARYVAK